MLDITTIKVETLGDKPIDATTTPNAATEQEKKAIQQGFVEKKNYMWLYILLVLIILAIAVWFIWFKK